VSGPRAPGRIFPLAALVDQDELRLALALSALDPLIGGVLLRGDKGSGKTTAARALAALLPGEAPFVELPVGAGEDRVVGSVDLRGLLADGRPRFVPGLLQQAHGGVLYVDEVNLLPDHLVDVLLDVASSGVNVVERDGVSHRHPARFVLVGSMNPEEGELRPQFLDRFGLVVQVQAPSDPARRAEAIERRLAYDADPEGFLATWQAEEAAFGARLAAARPAPLAPGLSAAVARLCLLLGVEGLRGDLVCLRAAAALAGLEGRPEAGPPQVRTVAAMALAHRRRRSPFDPPGIDPEELAAALDEVFGPPHPPSPAPGAPAAPDPPAAADPPAVAPPGSGPGEPGASGGGEDPEQAAEGPAQPGPPPAGSIPRGSTGTGSTGTGSTGGGRAGAWPPEVGAQPESGSAPAEQPWRPGRGRPLGLTGALQRAADPAIRARRASSGWSRRHLPTGAGEAGGSAAGRVVGVVEPVGRVRDLAPVATVRAAAARGAAQVGPEDLRVAQRQRTEGRLVVLAVDCSGSMGARRRLQAASQAAEGLLVEAYQRRDRLAVVTFAEDGARVAVAPTSSLEVARARLATVRTGGPTPLAAGVRRALEVALEGRRRGQRSGIVLVTDGRATASLSGRDPLAEAFEAADAVRSAQVPAVVVDVEEEGPARLGLAAELAERMGGVLWPAGGALELALRAALAGEGPGW